MANNQKVDKGTFILRSDFYPQIQLLTREQRGDLLTAIFAYTADGEITQLDNVTKMCFEFIRSTIDFYADKYDSTCKQNRENGRKGGRPRKAVESDENRPDVSETDRFSDKPTESEKNERFCNEPTDYTENRPVNIETDRLEDNRTDIEKTERLLKKPSKSEKTENTPFPPITPIPPCECECESTHTVVFERKGVVGGKQSPAALLAWVAEHYPAIYTMADPFTEAQAAAMLAKYRVEDIKRIVEAIDNKGGYRNRSAYATFNSYTAHDHILKERAATLKPHTYDEVCDLVSTGRYKMDDFETKTISGVKCWVRKIDVIRVQA